MKIKSKFTDKEGKLAEVTYEDVDSFDHLFSLVDELEDWMKKGKLDNVSPGKPDISDIDLKSFLDALQH